MRRHGRQKRRRKREKGTPTCCQKGGKRPPKHYNLAVVNAALLWNGAGCLPPEGDFCRLSQGCAGMPGRQMAAEGDDSA